MEGGQHNPYRSPGAVVQDKQPHPCLMRGFALAVPAGVVGFVVPCVVFSATALLRHCALGSSQSDLAANFGELPKTCIAAAIGVAIVFALAAILDTSPAVRLGFLRSLIYVGGATITGAVITAIVSGLFGLGPRSYTSDPWIWLRVSIGVAVPVAYTAIHTTLRFRRRSLAATVSGDGLGSPSS